MTYQTNQLNGIVKKISQTHKDGKVFFGVDAPGKFPRKNGLILCLGDAGTVRINMPVLITGTFESNYINCESVVPTYLNEEVCLSYLTTITKGIGIKKTTNKKILHLTGDKIFTLGSFELENLLLENSEFLKLGAYKIRQFCDQIYSDNIIRCKLETELEDANVDDIVKRRVLVNTLYAEYGEEAVEELRKDPYTVLQDTDVSIIGIEKLAKKYGIEAWSTTRAIGLMQYKILQEMNEGHTYVHASVVSQFVKEISQGFPYYQEIPDIILSSVLLHDKRIIFCKDNPHHMMLAEVYRQEQGIAKALKALLDVKPAHTIKIDDNKIHIAEEMTGFTYGSDQKNAFHMLESSAVLILTGGPGTGKTALVNGIVSLYHKYYPEDVIKFAAPTGRAAKRLSESVGYDATTIQRLIEYIPFKSHSPAARNKMNPIEANLIIIDESSMIDTELMAMFLDAVEVSPNTRVIFVGDKDQLPSVKCGDVFADMINSKLFPVYYLEENFRQNGEGSIVDNSKKINAGILPQEEKDFHMIQVNSEKEAMNLISSYMKDMYKTYFPFKTQVIEPTKFNFSGCANVNAMIHRDIVFKDECITPEIQPGDKIIFTRNEYVRKAAEDGDIAKNIVPLYVNGDMGIVEEIGEDYILINEDGEDVYVPLYAKNDMEMAYACTVHKFQGSEADNIIINLPRSAKRMMTRSFLYTATTRAKESVIIIYEGDTLEMCVSNKNAVARRTKLKILLAASG